MEDAPFDYLRDAANDRYAGRPGSGFEWTGGSDIPTLHFWGWVKLGGIAAALAVIAGAMLVAWA